MNGWLIFGGIVLLLILLFAQSVTVTATYEEKLDIKIKFLFFTIYPREPKKKKSPKRRKKKAAVREAEARQADGQRELPDEPSEEAGAQAASENAEAPKDGKSRGKPAKKLHKKKKGLGLTFAEIMEYVRSASPPIKRLFKKIRCRDLTVRYTVSADDAAKTAIKYGAVCAALYPVIEWLTTYFSVQAREVRVEADFSKKEDHVFAYGKIKLRLSTALGCILWLGVRVVKTYFNIKAQA